MHIIKQGQHSHVADDSSLGGRCGSHCHHVRVTFSERTPAGHSASLYCNIIRII